MKQWLTRLLVLLALSATVHAGEGRAATLRALSADLDRAEQLAREGNPQAEGRFRAALVAAERYGKSLLLARALDGLAAACRDAGRLDESVALYGRAIPLWEELLGREQPRLAVSLHNLGALHLERREPRHAAPLFRRAISIWAATLGPDSPEAVGSRRALAVAEASGASPE